MDEFRAGYAAIIGKPNVGKSTLLNAILGEKIAIISARPQTTRERLSGIYTGDQCQIVFVDTPGVIDPKDAFNEFLLGEVREALRGVDVALHLTPYGDPEPLPPEMRETLGATRAPLFLVVTKIDLARGGFDWGRDLRGFDFSRYAERFAISALRDVGTKELLAAIRGRLPVGAPFYDPEQLTDRDMRYLAAERVREKVFELARQEIPYGVAAQTEEFRERPEQQKTYISVNIYVERESQKGIIIGKNAAMLKAIGRAARQEIEALLGGPVFLELSVKVRKNWRKDETALREFGYARRRK